MLALKQPNRSRQSIRGPNPLDSLRPGTAVNDVGTRCEPPQTSQADDQRERGNRRTDDPNGRKGTYICQVHSRHAACRRSKTRCCTSGQSCCQSADCRGVLIRGGRASNRWLELTLYGNGRPGRQYHACDRCGPRAHDGDGEHPMSQRGRLALQRDAGDHAGQQDDGYGERAFDNPRCHRELPFFAFATNRPMRSSSSSDSRLVSPPSNALTTFSTEPLKNVSIKCRRADLRAASGGTVGSNTYRSPDSWWRT